MITCRSRCFLSFFLCVMALYVDARAADFSASATPSSAVSEMTARGVVKARTEAVIAVEQPSRILSLPVREGEEFTKGTTLIVFECARFKAQVSAASAAYNGEKLVYNNNLKLQARGASSTQEVALSQAQMDKAKAELEMLTARTDACVFQAPFGGHMVDLMVQEYESPAGNQPLMRIADTTELELEAIAPSQWLNWLQLGTKFSFIISETGQSVNARVTRLGAVVDPVSQTVKVMGVISDPTERVLPGMSGTAMFAHSGS